MGYHIYSDKTIISKIINYTPIYKEIGFPSRDIFIEIDVQAKTWEVTVLTKSGYKERYPQKASTKVLFDCLEKRFSNGEYHAAYDLGFSGFATYYALKNFGIDSVVTIFKRWSRFT
jgi:transposase